MIPQAYITEWRSNAPWQTEAQIEQDLILSRAITDIFSDSFLANSLAFRGGTALHKMFIQPAARYSEDIDLVQIKEGPIGPIIEAIRKQLNPWLGEPRWNLKEGRVTCVYRFNSESFPITPMRLKVEINTREHFTVLGFSQKLYEIKSSWFTNQITITTYALEELLGTKLRALYQRKKGRDLFDLVISLRHFPSLDVPKIIECFYQYMNYMGLKVSRAQFEENLAEKMNDNAFIQDISPLLAAKMSNEYNPLIEVNHVKQKIINCLHGEAWKDPENKGNKKGV